MTEELKPLFDDVAEWAVGSWLRSLYAKMFRRECLARRLKAQLRSRPNVWNMGLWPGKEIEDAAKVFGNIIDEQFNLGSTYFIPDDPMEMVGAVDWAGDLDWPDAISALQDIFHCEIPESALHVRTFGEFVMAVYELRDTKK